MSRIQVRFPAVEFRMWSAVWIAVSKTHDARYRQWTWGPPMTGFTWMDLEASPKIGRRVGLLGFVRGYRAALSRREAA
jgi:hypothetical protein